MLVHYELIAVGAAPLILYDCINVLRSQFEHLFKKHWQLWKILFILAIEGENDNDSD